MKKIFAILLCAALLLCMAGCAAEDAVTTGPTPTTDAPTAVEIRTDADSYTVTVGQMVPINATISDESLILTYECGNEAIATVNKYGKVVGVKAGTTEVTITASNGDQKVVTIIVEGPKYANVLRLALNVLYNDSVLGCFNTEYGPYVEIHEDGQYTVTFDCTMHLSESARNMGVKELSNLTAVFLYDHEVRIGNQMYSSVTACDIRWDEVTVNGQKLTITNSEFKSAMKATGIFDSNDPMNAWDGSAVEEVTVDGENHVLNINVDQPVTITITFTIRGLTFAE